MAKISTIGIAKRFCGRGGVSAIEESLLRQTLVAGNKLLATRLRKQGEIVSFKKRKVVTTQGAADNDIYFILCGSVRVLVNGYVVAVRHAGSHVGEMAAMDNTALRSASIVAEDEVVVLKVAQDQFIKIANSFKEVWRRMANEMASRLRERSRFLRNRNNIPVLFIGSSSESLEIANALKTACESKYKIEVRLWADGVFQASKTVIEDLMAMTDGCDFSVLVLTPDDKAQSRGKLKPAPRDNVIYELGLFTGALGRERSLIVMPSGIDIKVPTDLLGVTTLRYEPAKTASTTNKRLHSVAEAIIDRIKELGPK